MHGNPQIRNTSEQDTWHRNAGTRRWQKAFPRTPQSSYSRHASMNFLEEGWWTKHGHAYNTAPHVPDCPALRSSRGVSSMQNSFRHRFPSANFVSFKPPKSCRNIGLGIGRCDTKTRIKHLWATTGIPNFPKTVYALRVCQKLHACLYLQTRVTLTDIRMVQSL